MRIGTKPPECTYSPPTSRPSEAATANRRSQADAQFLQLRDRRARLIERTWQHANDYSHGDLLGSLVRSRVRAVALAGAVPELDDNCIGAVGICRERHQGRRVSIEQIGAVLDSMRHTGVACGVVRRPRGGDVTIRLACRRYSLIIE